MTNKIAALFVEAFGSYSGVPGVEVWDETRDARLYSGPHPVVAHPPCQRWGKLWAGNPSVIARTGIRKVKGDDNGCFASALTSVRNFGGVLEHPYGSHAWPHFGLAKPPVSGGWLPADEHGGFTCYVEQGRYGHYSPKPTYLYAVGCELPELTWGRHPVSIDDFPPEAVARLGEQACRRRGLLGFKGGGTDSSIRIATPPLFRNLLISIARSATKGTTA